MHTHSYFTRALFTLLALFAPAAILLLAPPQSTTGAADWSRLTAWLVCVTGLLGLLVLVGIKIRGRVLGVLIDERNRYSLSRLQITLWTVLVTGTVYTVFIANIVRSSKGDALWVDLDYNLVLLMGVSVASFVTAPMALNLKAEQPGDANTLERSGQQLFAKQELALMPSAIGQVLVKGSPNDARLADLIRGEDIGNATLVDLPRLQMLIITAVVLLSYGAEVGRLLTTGSWLVDGLPKLSPTLLLLVLVSHGGYVTGKLIPSTSSSALVTSTDTMRALRASQRAASLAMTLQTQFNNCAIGDPRYQGLRSSLGLAQSVTADATALLGRIGEADFRPDQISNVEGRVDALQASLQTHLPTLATQQIIDAPSVDTVRAIQRRLCDLGYSDILVTGIVDAPTGNAISAELAKLCIKRTDLHPKPYRFFEELEKLI